MTRNTKRHSKAMLVTLKKNMMHMRGMKKITLKMMMKMPTGPAHEIGAKATMEVAKVTKVLAKVVVTKAKARVDVANLDSQEMTIGMVMESTLLEHNITSNKPSCYKMLWMRMKEKKR